NGKVLLTGGENNGEDYLDCAELYDSTTSTWTLTGNRNVARKYHTATVLGNGNVLVTGGLGNMGYLSITELYDPTTDTWTLTTNMNVARAYHSASILGNGNVLVTGGVNANHLKSAELY
ncbi:unnamed protein product, partial [Adineta steineri]